MKNSFEYLTEFAEPNDFHRWEEVDLEVHSFTDLGMKVAINGEFSGLVYADQIYDQYREGQKLKGYITAIREDGRIDVSLQPDKGRHVLSTLDRILAHLKKAGGQSPLGDKSSPEAIRKEFQVSKKVYKQAIGGLYKQGEIKITDQGIELVRH